MASASLLAALRRRIARIEGAAIGQGSAEPHALAGASGPVNPSSSARWTSRSRFLPLGVPDLDAAFTGAGVRCAGTHEIAAPAGDDAAAIGFALALISRLTAGVRHGRVVIVQERMAASQHGGLYAPGLHAFGVDPDRVLFVSARQTRSALWVVEEAARSGAVVGVLADLWDSAGLLDLTATRRINLAARQGGAMALLAVRTLAGTSAALTRWHVGAAPSRGPAPRLLGRPAFDLSLVRNRHGRTGAWTVEWDPHERAFVIPADPVRVARPAPDRPPAAAGAWDGRARALG
jgi:protein ImuA